MKNMKKTIAAVLALAMMLSLSVSGFAYYSGTEDINDAYSEKYIMALNTLYGLGIIKDNNPDKYESEVTRADFAAYVQELLGGRAVNNIPEPANQTITLGEAVKMLVDGTENTICAEKYGYMGIAGQMGITHGLVRMQSYDNLIYGAAIQMLYNSMRVTPGDTATVSANGIEYEFDSSHTVLTEYLDVEYKNGFVTADGFWSLNPENVLDEDQIEINGQTFTVKYSGLGDYVGFYVNYYYSNKEDKILAVEKSSNAKKVVLDSNDVTSFGNNTYTYYADGKRQNYKIEDGAYIITNFSPNMAVDVNMHPENSDIILVDSNGNNIYETVFIKTYTEIKVSMLDAQNHIITGKGGATYYLSEDIPARVYLNGKKVEYANVTADMHASLVIEPAAKMGEKSIVREIYLSDKKISGEIKSISNSGDNTKITVDETEYDVNLSASDKKKIKFGINCEFSLNFKGEIAYMDIAGGKGGFGYVMTVGEGKGISKPTQMKLLAADGTFPTLIVSDKCTVNNTTPTESIVELFTDAEGETEQQLIWFETNSKGEISKITLPLASGSTLSSSDYRLHVSVDSSDKKYEYGGSSKTFEHTALMGENTVVFNVPSSNSDSERAYTVESKPISQQFKIYNFEKNEPYADAVVSVRQSAVADYGDCAGPGPMIHKNNYGDFCIVLDCSKGYVEEYDGYYDKIEFINSATGKTDSKILADNAMYVAIGTPNASGEVIEYTVGAKDLKPGDIFNYTLNVMDEIGTVHKVYDASDKSLVKGRWTHTTDNGTFDYTDTTNFGSWTGYFKAIQGYAVDATENYLAITRGGPSNIASIDRSELEFFTNQQKTYVYEITSYGKDIEVRKITMGQITPSLTTDERVVITTSSGALTRFVAVYKTEN